MRTVALIVPSPAEPARLDRFVAANLHGLSRKQVKKLIDAGQVRIAGRRERKAARLLTPGLTVEVDYRPSMIPAPDVDQVIFDERAWLAVVKPPGIPTHRTDDDALGVPEALGEPSLRPVHRLDRETSGALLLARTDAAAAALSELFATRAMEKVYRAIVHPAPKDEAGDVAHDGMELRWSVLRRSADGSRAELAVRPKQGKTHQIRILLAHAGHPIVGDLEHGRAIPGGAPRMALHCEQLSWPDGFVTAGVPVGWSELLDPPAPPPDPSPAKPRAERRRPSGGRRTLAVSAATARICRGGHPWVIRDRDTGDLGGFRAGDLADLVDPKGDFVGVALVDPTSSICARVIDSRPTHGVDWGARARAALEVRAALLDDEGTDALRLIHGEADGLPGLHVDLWGDVIVATRQTAAVGAFTDEVYGVLADRLRPTTIWERDHFADLRARGGGAPSDAELPGRLVAGDRRPEPWHVRERGLTFEVTPLGGLTTGLYPDQRRNRARLATAVGELAEGRFAGEEQRIANLFGHTGAFSVALAAAGAASAITVDLAPRYVEWTRRNLRLNGFDPDVHLAVAADSAAWLADSSSPLHGVVLDPPAFARSRGRSGDWSARRDYAAIVEGAARRLAPGGWMLCCVNVGGLKRGWLKKQVEAGFRAAGRTLERTGAARPSPDFPTRKGFGEGAAFQGLIGWAG